MKLLLTDFYHQATIRFASSLKEAGIDFTQVNITYDGWLPEGVRNPFAYYTGNSDKAEGALHYNQISVPKFAEIRNTDGARAEILQGDRVIGYVIYQLGTARLVKEVEWLNREGKLVVVQRYNRQGVKFADALFSADGKEYKTIYYRDETPVITMDIQHGGSVLLSVDGRTQVFPNLTLFVADYIQKLECSADEILFNSMSTPFFVSNQLTALPGTLYFQETIKEELPGNLQMILTGETPTRRVLFENAKQLERAQEKAINPKIPLSYLGAIENFRRENTFRRRALTITRSDQILYDTAVAKTLASLNNTQWTIAAPTEISDKLRNFGNAHKNVTVIETLPLKEIDKLLAENDFYLDINQGQDTSNIIQRAYLEGLLVIGDKAVQKNGAYEVVLEKESELLEALKLKNKQNLLNFLRSKKGTQATIHDYTEVFK